VECFLRHPQFIMDMENINILLVDDDEEDRAFFAEALEELNIPHHIVMAKDCIGLFEILQEDESFDVIFLDINMPVIDGRECLKKIKLHENYKNIPVIIYSSSSYEDDVEDTYKSGAHYYFVKPYAHINLLSSLKIIFSMNWKKGQSIPLREDYIIKILYN
jgi:CheY-like chemotaxis protein